MAIGARIGARIGASIGASIGGDPLGALTWTKDATSGKGTPASLAEWNNVLITSGLSGKSPSMLVGCQEAAGNLADAITGINLTASGTGLSYQNAVAGWSRKAVQTTDAGTGTFSSASASLPDISTTSMLVMIYEQLLAAPAATRSTLTMGTTVCDAEYTLTPRNRQVCGANNLIGGVDPTGSVRCKFILIDRTAARTVLYTSQEKVTTTFGATATGKTLKMGAAGAASAGVAYLYLTAFFGAAAEMTDLQIKTLAATLGWSLP